ncbi:HIRA-interacting protein 3 [Heteronotia binoei]|uniref:HIRA-interacting protein 3 n=1 Tax=Heteronotia binoei TaxID=13085 RepID=UPI002931E137|nr:HIRA-interacting protein 3 [Heteronotia binoei]
MATLVVAEQDMERFVKGLFQGSPDLSTLTHAIVRKKYLTHIGKEALTKEEKDHLKRLIEKELLQIQIEDSGDEQLLIKFKPSAKAGGQKRALCASDSSGEEVKSQHEQKKQRTMKELELSSDEEDSGIDSKKAQVCRGPKHAGKSSSSSDHGDSRTSESEEERVKDNAIPTSQRTSRAQRGRGKGKRSLSEGEESEGGQGSEVEEEISKRRKATKYQMETLESNSENDLKKIKLQRKKGMGRDEKGPNRVGKGECRKEDKQRGKRESEGESDLSETCGKKRTDWSDSAKDRAGGGGWKSQIPRGHKAREQSQSEEESDCASREKQKTQRKVTGDKHQKKNVSVEESESDSDDTEGKGQMKKDVHKSKSQRAGAEKWKTDSDSGEREVLKKKVRNQGMEKAQGRGMRRKELEGNQKQRSPIKQQGGHKPKRRVSRKELGSETEEKGSEQKKTGSSSGSENESQSEAEQRGKGRKQSEKIAVSRDDSESSSEETAGVTQRQKRMSEERKVNKEVSGGESSEEEEEEPKKKGAEKSQRESVSEAKSESDSEDSSSESTGKVKNRSWQEQRTQKPKGRSNSKEEMSESEKEAEHSHSGDKDSPRSSKKQHHGKDKEHHSTKGEDHPSVQRLKRYIRECGVRKNYKKLLMGCRSRKAQVEVLRQELENLGLKGTPTLAKCKALKKKLEEAAEVASLDLSNIITTEGRPRRRNVWSLYSKPEEPPGSPDESPIRRPATDWSRLQGVINSDDESD